MKYLISLLIGLVMIGTASASQIGIQIIKDVNGGYRESIPVIIDAQSQFPFLPKAYVKAEPIFTAPRGDWTKLNHSRFDLGVGCGITLLKGKLEFETGSTYWWAGNDQGIPESIEWNNAFRYYWEF